MRVQIYKIDDDDDGDDEDKNDKNYENQLNKGILLCHHQGRFHSQCQNENDDDDINDNIKIEGNADYKTC